MYKGLTNLTVALWLSACVAMPQNAADRDTPAPAAPAAKLQFFAGAVTEIDQNHVTVSRTAIGRPSENRTFVINSETKFNKGAVKPKARVTVRYRHAEEGDIALEIQLRPSVHSKHA